MTVERSPDPFGGETRPFHPWFRVVHIGDGIAPMKTVLLDFLPHHDEWFKLLSYVERQVFIEVRSLSDETMKLLDQDIMDCLRNNGLVPA